MVQYRRNRVPGGTYFFTVTLKDRKATTLADHIDLLRQAFRYVQQRRPFCIDAAVILPDHLHAIWTLPPEDSNFPARWHAIKSRFTCALSTRGVALVKDARGEYDLWQRRYWEHTIRDATDLESHVNYIHYNPVKHGYVSMAKDWPYSSFHRFVECGIYPADWGLSEMNFEGVGHE